MWFFQNKWKGGLILFCFHVAIIDKSIQPKELTHFVVRESKLHKLGDILWGKTPVWTNK